MFYKFQKKAEIDFTYHKYDKATALLNQLVKDYPKLCSLYSIGKSVEGKFIFKNLYKKWETSVKLFNYNENQF